MISTGLCRVLVKTLPSKRDAPPVFKVTGESAGSVRKRSMDQKVGSTTCCVLVSAMKMFLGLQN